MLPNHSFFHLIYRKSIIDCSWRKKPRLSSAIWGGKFPKIPGELQWGRIRGLLAKAVANLVMIQFLEILPKRFLVFKSTCKESPKIENWQTSPISSVSHYLDYCLSGGNRKKIFHILTTTYIVVSRIKEKTTTSFLFLTHEPLCSDN